MTRATLLNNAGTYCNKYVPHALAATSATLSLYRKISSNVPSNVRLLNTSANVSQVLSFIFVLLVIDAPRSNALIPGDNKSIVIA